MRDRHLDLSSRRPSGLLVLSGLLLLIGLPGISRADGWRDSDPARTTAGDLEDHQAESKDPSSLEAESHDMVQGHSEDPDDMVVESEQEDVVEAGHLEDHHGSSTDLQDLRFEKPDQGQEVIDDGRLARVVETNLSAKQLVAKQHLERAQANAERARSVYGDMIRRNYPRGDARKRIVEQRDETLRALEKARSDFDDAMGS